MRNFIVLLVLTVNFLSVGNSAGEDLAHNHYTSLLYESLIRGFAQDPDLKLFYGYPYKKAGAKLYYWDTVEKKRYHSLGMIYYNATQDIEDTTEYYNHIIDMVDLSVGSFFIGIDLAKNDFSSLFKQGLKELVDDATENYISQVPINDLYKEQVSKQLSDLMKMVVLDVASGESRSKKYAALYQLLMKKAAEASINWAGWFAEIKAHHQYKVTFLVEEVLSEFYQCGADFTVFRERLKVDKGVTSLSSAPSGYTENDWLIQLYATWLGEKKGYSEASSWLLEEDYARIHRTIDFVDSYMDDFFTYHEEHPEDFKPRRSSLRPIISLILNDDNKSSVIIDGINKEQWFAERAQTNDIEDWSAVEFSSDYVTLHQDRTDRGPGITSIGFRNVPGKKLKITRTALIHSHISNSYMGEDEFFTSVMNIHASDSSERKGSSGLLNLAPLCSITYLDYEYKGDWDNFILNDRNNPSAFVPSVWDKEFQETFIYNPQNGEASYGVNDNNVQAQCEPLELDFLRIFINTFGWWMGHYTQIKSFRAEWID